MRTFLRNAVLMLAGLALLGGVIGYVTVSNGGLGANHEPGRLEEFAADHALHLSIPSAINGTANPNAADPDAWRRGAPVFGERCAMCHGADGHAKSDLAQRMYPRVPDLAIPRVQAFSDGALFWIIQSGIRLTGMPGFKGVVSDDETWQLVSFVRRVPSLTPADLEAVHQSHGNASAVAQGTTIVMDGTRFQPDDLEVPAGSTITFINKDFFPHNVRSDAAHLRSGQIDVDGSWSVQLNTPGTFEYVCTLHPGMKGVLRVR
jgi:plastocyanin